MSCKLDLLPEDNMLCFTNKRRFDTIIMSRNTELCVYSGEQVFSYPPTLETLMVTSDGISLLFRNDTSDKDNTNTEDVVPTNITAMVNNSIMSFMNQSNCSIEDFWTIVQSAQEVTVTAGNIVIDGISYQLQAFADVDGNVISVPLKLNKHHGVGPLRMYKDQTGKVAMRRIGVNCRKFVYPQVSYIQNSQRQGGSQEDQDKEPFPEVVFYVIRKDLSS